MPGQAIVTIGGNSWSCSVATTPTELSQGLSGVPSMLAGEGKLFDLGSSGVVKVNAYNMLFPLSVVFISESLKVTEIAPTLAIGADVTTTVPCRYFLEVNAGEAVGILPGDSVVVTGYTPTSGSVVNLILTLMITAVMVAMIARAWSGGLKEAK